MKREELIKELAMHMYCDSFTQYGTCSPARWKQTSEEQRQAFLNQARSVLLFLETKGRLSGIE